MTQSNLLSVIDKLETYKTGKRDIQGIAYDLLANLTTFDLLVLASWDVASTILLPVEIDPRGMTIKIYDRYDRQIFSATLVYREEVKDKPIFIDYPDSPYCVVSDCPPLSDAVCPKHSFTSLLIALILIRDDLDDVLILGGALKWKKIKDLAAKAGLQEEHFCALAQTIESFERALSYVDEE